MLVVPDRNRVSDTPKIFMPQRLTIAWEREWKGIGIHYVGMGGNGNVKGHSRSSLVWLNDAGCGMNQGQGEGITSE